MVLLFQPGVQVQTGEDASASQVATQAGPPAVPEPAGEGDPEGVARALEPGLEPGTPATPASPTTIPFENNEVARLGAEGGGFLGEEAPPEYPPPQGP